MIDYAQVRKGDILRIVGVGAPGYAQLGDLVRVIDVRNYAVTVENKDGETVDFLYNCGAARLELTEWRDDFPPLGVGASAEVPGDRLKPSSFAQ